MESALEAIEKHPNVVRVYLHVQTSNTAALEFYSKFGFSQAAIIPDYYRKITPTDAVLLEKLYDSGVAAAGSSAPKA